MNELQFIPILQSNELFFSFSLWENSLKKKISTRFAKKNYYYIVKQRLYLKHGKTDHGTWTWKCFNNFRYLKPASPCFSKNMDCHGHKFQSMFWKNMDWNTENMDKKNKFHGKFPCFRSMFWSNSMFFQKHGRSRF